MEISSQHGEIEMRHLPAILIYIYVGDKQI